MNLLDGWKRQLDPGTCTGLSGPLRYIDFSYGQLHSYEHIRRTFAAGRPESARLDSFIEQLRQQSKPADRPARRDCPRAGREEARSWRPKRRLSRPTLKLAMQRPIVGKGHRRERELFAAVASGDSGRVRELLAADPAAARAKDGEGATPLHYATLSGRREIAELLLQHGADVNARDGRFGATPAGWAIEYLREAGGLLGIEIEYLLVAIRENDVRWVRRFLTRLPTLARAKDPHGKALSDYASESGSDEIARLFEAVLGQR